MIYQKIKSFLIDIAGKLDRRKFKFGFVEETPEKLKKKYIYIIHDGTEPDSLVFDCPCGCSNQIQLNLLGDCRPQWRFDIKGRRISIYPSVAATKGCKSHFWIKESKVVWFRS